MKPALIVAIMLTLLVYFAPRGYGQQSTADGQNKSNNETPLSGSQVHADTKASTPQQEPPHWYKSPEWVLVIVGIVTAFVIGWQSLETRKAAEATRDSAQAAQTNSEAFIASERAWLVAELVPICRKAGKQWHRRAGSGWASLSDDEILSGYHMRHRLKVTNLGRTPAHVIRFCFNFHLYPEGATKLSDSIKESLASVRRYERYVEGGKSFEIEEFDINWYINKSPTAIRELKETAVFQGYVEYTHTFNMTETHRADFLYSYKQSTASLEKIYPDEQEIKSEKDG